jgi:hypothetical protein
VKLATFRRVVGASALAGAIAVSHYPARAEMIDRVLAVAAGELIMLSDVIAARDLGLVVPDARAVDPVRAVLEKLIDRELVLAEVERYAPPDPAVQAIDREVEIVRGRFPSREALDAALARSGIDEKHLRETLRQSLRIRAYEDQRFTVPPPSDQELRRYFASHMQTFSRDGQPSSFDDVRSDIAVAVSAEKRRALIDEWLSGLRRRADVIDLYLLPVR